ncbi:acyl-CoA dehydrogenase family protein [Roseibium sp. RKSG952]|uniref:acyl-CoA dehydrogenase family protein n=1 Tax=Roseibium sp. RKSG952 TaxID=2529384 RepID=UPI0012BBAA3D|nr:acyl-CoA dehydrogenase family protein [Roseibium sp. RKSG952]MTH95340.1 hypothetical protein [Roseibium sp. RKSG952]
MKPVQDRHELLVSFVRDRIEPFVETWEAGGHYPPELYREAGEQGILAMGDPHWREDPASVVTAPSATRLSYIRSLNRAGSQAIAVALSAHLISLKILLEGAPDLFRLTAADILSGHQVINIALTEPGGGSNLNEVTTFAERGPNGRYLVSGNKAFVCHAQRASWLIVTARHGSPEAQEIGLFLVALGSCAKIKPLRPIGWQALPIGDVHMQETEAYPIALPGKPARRLLQSGLAAERLNLAALAVQSSVLALEQAVAFARERDIAGTPLLKRQAIAHRLADMKREICVSAAFLEQVASSSDKPDPIFLAMAKNTASQCFEAAARNAAQIAGGQGCLDDNLLARLYRDSRITPVGGGSEEMMLEIIASSL